MVGWALTVKCPELTRLEFVKTDLVTDIFSKLLPHLPKLKQVVIEKCYSVTNDAVLQYFTSQPTEIELTFEPTGGQAIGCMMKGKPLIVDDAPKELDSS